MKLSAVLIIIPLYFISVCSNGSEEEKVGASIDFEPFLWGTATAAYQVEGAVKEDGRGPTIWDEFVRIPNKVTNGDTGDIAADSYHLYPRDILLMKNLGVNSYRFSIAWSRIFPSGRGQINQAGVDYYNVLIDMLIEANIQPIITLFHWDLPAALEHEYKGILGDDFVSDFVSYAQMCFDLFNDRVKKWITFNEPWTYAYVGYGTYSGVFAPGRCSNRRYCTEGNSSTEPYIGAHNIIRAHARAVELYHLHYKHKQYNITLPPRFRHIRDRHIFLHSPGMIGITLNMDWAEPYTPHYQPDQEAANRRKEFQLGWFLDPIMFGRYPESMVQLVGDRLPQFSEEDRQRMLLYPIDYLGLNHYSSKYYVDRQGSIMQMSGSEFYGNFSAQDEGFRYGGWAADQLSYETKYNSMGSLIGPQGASSWLNAVPWGFYNTIMYVHKRYGVSDHGDGLLIYITENGCDAPDEDEIPLPDVLNDTFRISYYQGYLSALDRAIADGANVKGYFAWSLLDNFEWADGYSKRFGLHYVDYTDPHRRRYAKQSAGWYHDYILSHRDTYRGRPILIPPIHFPLDNNDPSVEPPPPSPVPFTDDPAPLLPCVIDNSCSWSDYFYAAIAVYADKLVNSSYSQQSLAPSVE